MPRKKRGKQHPVGRKPKKQKKTTAKDDQPRSTQKEVDSLFSNWEEEKAILFEACKTPCTPISPVEDDGVETTCFDFPVFDSEHTYAKTGSLSPLPLCSIEKPEDSHCWSIEDCFAHSSTSSHSQVDIIVDAEFPIPHGPEYPGEYLVLRDRVKAMCAPGDFEVQMKSERIKFITCYHAGDEQTIVQTSVTITPSYTAEIRVHNQPLQASHELWKGLPSKFDTVDSIWELLKRLGHFQVCPGNQEKEYTDLLPPLAGLSETAASTVQAYHEFNFIQSSIRSSVCLMLTDGRRCHHCQKVRNTLRVKQWKRDHANKDSTSKFTNTRYLNNEQLQDRARGLSKEKRTLQSRIATLERQVKERIRTEGHDISSSDHLDINGLATSVDSEARKAFPPDSFQRIFWEQQLKYNNAKDGRGMRWHPLIIKWCLFLKSRSGKAYQAMRKSGFIKLPSERTLVDYSHFTKPQTGFNEDILDHITSECDMKGMFVEGEEWRRYVGLLQDEIRIKQDIVYSKSTGELIGYVDLGNIGNELNRMDEIQNDRQSQVARYMLVLMVRGLSSDLKYPLAAFATNGISADFLYPIIWEAIEELEINCGLMVLFVTCDGASPNRKFFELHRGTREGPVYWVDNPYAEEDRKLYFISDPPHLLKTARNCFGNSHSHQRSRTLFKNGKSISWMHVVSLFEEKVENNIYSPCPKLTRKHIDLTSFSQMKVNLAAQVFSATVGNALELYYGQHVSETVKFIRLINDFFDILNTKSYTEGFRQRNPNLKVFTTPDDPRLDWLENDFLGYFEEWKRDIETHFPDEAKSTKAAKQLSHQTLTGLKITVLSVTECIRFLLRKGVPFVRTVVFNQDVLEQHFGHYRHKGGSNDNPSCFDVIHTLNTIRVAHGQAIAPIRGNITGNVLRQVPDVNVPLPRRAPRRR